MRRRTVHSPWLPWMQLALKTGEMLAASSVVIPVRLGRMASAGHSPSAHDRREFARMGPEKLQAATESWFAVALAWQQWQWRWWMQAWQPWTATRTRAIPWAGLAGTALAPIHRTATANARRLTRGKSRRGAVRR